MRSIQTDRQQQQSRQGAALVEFAIIAPFFLTLALGTIELGNALRVSNTLSAAVRQGGRLSAMDWEGIVPAGTTANQKVIDDIRNFITASGLPGNQITVTITSAEGSDQGQTFDLNDPNNKLRLFRISADVLYSDVSSYPITFMKGHKVTAALVFRAGRVTLTNN